MGGEKAYQAFPRVIENASVITATYEDSFLVIAKLYLEKVQLYSH